MKLFGRRVLVRVDTLEISELDVAFHIEKTLKAKTPNTAEVQVWNLNPDHRKHLQELEKVTVEVLVGYAGSLSGSTTRALDEVGANGLTPIFRGDLRDVVSRRDGPDWVTSMTSGDGDRALKKRKQVAFAPGATVADVIKKVAELMGVGIGNTVQKAINADVRDTNAKQFFNGFSLEGSLSEALDLLAKSCDLEWSIQDGQLQFLELGKPLHERGLLLSPATGLVGSPEPGNRGLVHARCLMIPDAPAPGRRLELRSQHVNGTFRVETTRHTGATHDNDWYIELELKNEERRSPQP